MDLCKVFISYKHNESQELMDVISDTISNEQLFYYEGETSLTPYFTDALTNSIKDKVIGLITKSNVTIVILSPNMKKSNWIEWEIECSLKNILREDGKHHKNGIVAIISKIDDSYSWFVNEDEDGNISYNKEYLPYIIGNNNENVKPEFRKYNENKEFASFQNSYIAFVKEDDFLRDPDYYVYDAWDKADHCRHFYLRTKI